MNKDIELRDRFAMAALTGLTADPKLTWSVDRFAGAAYNIADAMMERREWTPDGPDSDINVDRFNETMASAVDVFRKSGLIPALATVRDMPDDPEPANDEGAK